MAVIKKYAEVLTQNLTSFGTFIVDTNPNSQYFKITEFKDTFTAGKNGFLIEGSEHLKETTEIKIQILDVNGDPIYYEPGNGIPEYYEGTSKLVAVYVYEDTPIGSAKITILGELKTYVDDGGVVRDIPDEWKGVYNLKWEKTFQVNKLLSNEDKVRFYRRPEVSITEIVKPIYSNLVRTITQTGNVNGTPQIPSEGQSVTGLTIPTSYLLTTVGNSFWTGSVTDNYITLTNKGVRLLADDIINDRELTVSTPYNEDGIVKSLTNEPYSVTFNYIEGIDNLKTALTGSFAKITISDLTTFVGDVARVKIFRRSQSDLSDFQFIQEIQLESNELLTDLETKTKNQEYYGSFDLFNYKTYWCTSSNNITTQFNQDYLYNSVKLNSVVGTNNFFTTKSLDITKDTEYSLNFNVKVASPIDTNDKLVVYLSGSRASTYNNVTTTVGRTQNILTLTSDSSLLQKSQITANFKAEELSDTRLFFEVSGNDWYISDISLRASQETAFSPDEITFIQPIPRNLPAETFEFLFQFYDINNNYIPVTVTETKTFDGGNLNFINKDLQLIPSSLYFQFDSGSGNGNPIPPTQIFIDVIKSYLTGSVNFTSRSFDFFNNELFNTDYVGVGTQYPGFLLDRNLDTVRLTVENFTGSKIEGRVVQYIEFTGECEGVTDSIVITRVTDGKGGVNHIIRPYRGTQIRNSSTASLEIQAVRIDGINEIELAKNAQYNWGDIQLHVLSASLNPATEPEKFINLALASSSKYVKGLITGSLGSREINYNAIFDRDSIDTRRTIYLMSSASAAGAYAYSVSASVLTSIILEDLQDGLDTPSVIFNADTFNIDPRNERTFRPSFAFATASFYKRGTTEPITSSFKVFPSMSINKDYVPEYWLYYTTQSTDKTISVVGRDENKNIIDSLPTTAYVGQANKQSKNLTITFTYTEPYTSASISVDKTFSIVPDGKPGDETIIFEVTPAAVTLKANAKGVVNSYSSSLTEIRLKQGSRYLNFTASKGEGTFFIVSGSITGSNVIPGNIINPIPPGFNKDYTGSLFIGAASAMNNLSGSVRYDVEIQPYYTSSIYTASIVQNFTKVLDGAPQLEIILTPTNPNLISDEVGYVSDYTAANTILKIKEGNDYLLYNSMSFAPGTFWVEDFTQKDIKTASLHAVYNTDNALIRFHKFDYPYVSASVDYHIVAYPYSLGPGHSYTSSVFAKTQTFTKSVTPPKARGVAISATSNIVNYNSDGETVSPAGDIILTAVATNTTGSVYYQFFKDNIAYTGIQSSATATVASADAAAPGETATWKVKIRDGNNLVATPVRAEAELTIAGIQEGIRAYNAALTNEVSSPVYKVSGEFNLSGTGTSITATKGNESLTHVSTFSAQTLDNFGNEIGSLGEYKVTIESKSGHITLAGGLGVGGTVPTVGGIATIGQLTGWTDPNTNTTATIVYKIDFENNKAVYYKTQSFSVQFEGATGPGIVMRGVWKNSTNYIGAVETTNNRRDAVIWPDPAGYNNETHYWAAVSGSGPSTYVNPTTSTYYVGGSPPVGFNLIGAQQPDNGGSTPPWVDSEYWKYLGQEEFFVAAKIAIFEESFVKNTINVGNDAGSAYANVVIAGGRTDPYIAIGQNGTTGASGDQASAGVIGYEKEGIFLGIYENATPNGTTGRFSISNADGTKALKWDGQNLTIIGSITQVSPGQNEGSLRGAWTNGYTYYANDIVTYGGQSWQCTSAISHVANSSGGASNGVPGVGPWVVAAAAGTSGTSGTQGPPGANGSSGTSGVNGADGAVGPGVVFRGKWTAGTTYIKDNTISRVDVVQSNIDNLYYIAKLTHVASAGPPTQEPSGGSGISGTPATYWSSFGAQFSSVATGILLAENATITVGLVIGSTSSPTGFIRSANADTITTGTGFYLDNGGSARFGTGTGVASPKYIYFNGASGTLTIKGSVTIDDGSIGNWIVESGGNIRDTNSRIILNPSIPEIQMNDSTGLKKLSLNPSDSLQPLGSFDITPAWTSGTPNFGATTSTVTTNSSDAFPVTGNAVYSNSSDTFNIAAGRTGVYTITIDNIPTLNVTNTSPTLPTATATVGNPNSCGYPVPYQGAVFTAIPTRAYFRLEIYFEVLNSGGTVIHSQYLNQGIIQGPYAVAAIWSSSTGASWDIFTPAGADQPATVNNPTASPVTFTVNFSATGNYYCRYKLVAQGASTTNVSLSCFGTYSYTYTSFTKGQNETDNLDSFFTFIYPSNFTEVASGGIQIVSGTDQYVKIRRYAAGSPILSELIETQGGLVAFRQSTANVNNTTLFVNGVTQLQGKVELGSSWASDTTKPFYTELKGGLVLNSGIAGALVLAGSVASPTYLFDAIASGQTIIFARKNGTSDRYQLPYYVDGTNNATGYDIVKRGHKLIIFNTDDATSCYVKGLLINPTSYVELQGGACWTLIYLGDRGVIGPSRDKCWVLTSTYDNTW